MKELFIGFDTSNYTTSVAVCDGCGNILANMKCPLPVAEGERGLRQSEAVFAHVKNLPLIAEQIRAFLSEYNSDGTFVAAACSFTPRTAEGSYMPCFLVGRAVAETVCAFLNIPLYETSHQAGHIMAAAASACKKSRKDLNELLNSEHIALHVSGGTTDLLYVKPDKEHIFEIRRIGGTVDANAGQIIDRTGVRLGFSFPCGPQLDSAALEYRGKITVGKLSVKGLDFNLSGLENKAETMIKKGSDTSEVSAFVLEYIARSIERMLGNTFEIYGQLPVVFAGGVMSSAYIKKRLCHIGLFSEPQYSADNAAGVALIGSILHAKANLTKQEGM